MNVLASLQPQCPYCEEHLVWSVDLLVKLQQMDKSEDNEFDQAILEAIKQKNGKDKVIHMEDIPFRVWLADDPPSFFLEGWCPKCKRVSAPVFPLVLIAKKIREMREPPLS